jgi:hypothetical protein
MPQLLSINNYYYLRGGSEAVYFEHNRLFERAGWEVVPFSMQNARNQASEWSEHFINQTDDAGRSPMAKLSRAVGAIYSPEAARCCACTQHISSPVAVRTGRIAPPGHSGGADAA